MPRCWGGRIEPSGHPITVRFERSRETGLDTRLTFPDFAQNERRVGVTGLAPAVAMIAVFALTAGGIYLMRGGRDRGKGGLMLACAAVILGNVVIWTV